ncbi:hypothetical protein PoB_005026800 [Plakobranchus ocellatus]|uniref:Uncharacterized protein n=1 Tax=Plakobranchus ocellatus TaxID=259542 RepID=A0AAV4BX18_9GAST|nr:hypothetical protein PoB_005026800 [Plakobranchus ocellatus]
MDFNQNCLTGLLKRTAILRFVKKNGLYFQELWTGLAAGCVVSSTVYAMGVSRTVTFDMTIFATSNTHSSRFLTPVFAVAIALALIAAHWERDVRSEIKSQVPRTYSTRRLRAANVQCQEYGVCLNFVLTLRHLDTSSVSEATISSSDKTVDHDCELREIRNRDLRFCRRRR